MTRSHLGTLKPVSVIHNENMNMKCFTVDIWKAVYIECMQFNEWRDKYTQFFIKNVNTTKYVCLKSVPSIAQVIAGKSGEEILHLLLFQEHLLGSVSGGGDPRVPRGTHCSNWGLTATKEVWEDVTRGLRMPVPSPATMPLRLFSDLAEILQMLTWPGRRGWRQVVRLTRGEGKEVTCWEGAQGLKEGRERDQRRKWVTQRR